MANGLAGGADLDTAGGWLTRARSLTGKIWRVDDALRQAEESWRPSWSAACRGPNRTDG